MVGNGSFNRPRLPDFEESARRGAKYLPWLAPWIVGALLILVGAFTSYYQIEPDEVGVVLRFGAYERTTEPGPHFKLPFGIESVVKVPVQRQLKLEFGFRTVRADVRTEYDRQDDYGDEATMLTGDLNVADVEWIVQYKVRRPYLYLFKVRSVTDTLRDMSESVMRQVVGDRAVSEVLTSGREEIQVEAKQQLQQLCDQYGNGIEIQQLVLQDVNPPESVRPSFNAVNEAIQEKERAINEARQEYNRVIPEARGRALQQIQSAEGYATERVNRAQGDVQRFLALRAEYQKAPKVTRQRLYLEALGEIMGKAGPRFVMDEEMKGILPLLSVGAKGGAK